MSKKDQKVCCVYWLYDAGCSTPEESGYVGISCKPAIRIRGHRKSKKFPEFSVKILFEGTRHECSALEYNLRPRIGIGWNLGTGGRSTHGTLGKNFSLKTRNEMRKAHAKRSKKEKKRLAKIFSEKSKGNKSRTGQKQSVEERAKRSVLMLGNKNSVGNRNAAGRVMPVEQRAAIIEKNEGQTNSFRCKGI